MNTIRYSNDRGQVDHGWLQSHHTFSFGNYYDPEYMGVSALRVINDDKVALSSGFGTHSHQDMEIISYIKKGCIEHKDNMGNVKKLVAGEFQVMSAGSGVTHSEYNPSETESLEFLQIWIQPDVKGIAPAYQQRLFDNKNGLQLIASPDGHDNSLVIHQNALLYKLLLEKYQSTSYSVTNNRTIYVHVVSGGVRINNENLSNGDGITITSSDVVEFVGTDNVEALIFDLP